MAEELQERTYAQALGEALREEMARDPNVVAYGEDFRLGYVWPVSRGLVEEFGEQRVLDAPLSEQMQVGLAVGAALAGVRCVVEVQYSDFAMLAMDEIVNQAAKLCYMTGGQATTGMVVRLPYGHLRNYGAQHSQTLYGMFAHVPGLRVAVPATAADAKGLLKSAVRCGDPVVFFEHKRLYNVKGMVPAGDDTLVPFGEAAVLREGSDVTIIAIGLMVGRALEAADALASEGIEVTVIDPRTLVPLDLATLVASVERTGRLLLVDEAVTRGGFAGHLAAEITQRAFDLLEAPPRRLGVPAVPMPYSPELEDSLIPAVDDICSAVRDLVAY
ncbi:MAG: Transketolase central region [Chthonomonadaceae bacterium]|nr:Transketolase central region [Chthonomonadaceae bacterium]